MFLRSVGALCSCSAGLHAESSSSGIPLHPSGVDTTIRSPSNSGDAKEVEGGECAMSYGVAESFRPAGTCVELGQRPSRCQLQRATTDRHLSMAGSESLEEAYPELQPQRMSAGLGPFQQQQQTFKVWQPQRAARSNRPNTPSDGSNTMASRPPTQAVLIPRHVSMCFSGTGCSAPQQTATSAWLAPSPWRKPTQNCSRRG